MVLLVYCALLEDVHFDWCTLFLFDTTCVIVRDICEWPVI
jgi:hypothetical protein